MALVEHILLLTFPAQGHINPSLQFAKRLIRLGVHVTFATTVFAQRRIHKSTGCDKVIDGLNLVTFSDGYDDGFKTGDDTEHYMSQFKSNGSRKLREIITASEEEGHPVTCIVYTLLLPWAGEVARSCDIPSVLLWIQPATALDIYYYYFNGYEAIIRDNANDPSWSIELPGLPQLTTRDLPSFLLPSSPPEHSFALSSFREKIQELDAQTNPKILVNTFDELEPEALKSIEKYDAIGIGPLLPSAFLDKNDLSDTSFGGDLFQKSVDYIEWLNSKPESSVVYVSFGSVLVLPKQQMEEIAHGLLESRHPFLWVIKEEENWVQVKEEDNFNPSSMEELKQQGMIVPWCSQLEVLTHPSLGCFVSHCGWNSSLESLASGVPVVAFPQWKDQGTNAKLIEDVWKTGVRVRAKANDQGQGIVDRQEVKRCIEVVMGEEEKREEIRRNAIKWKDLARAATVDGGSSDMNLKAFVKELGREKLRYFRDMADVVSTGSIC